MNRIRLIARAGIVAGAGALAAAILTPGGVGANFFDAATAEASIEVGDFGCTFTAPVSSVTFTPTNPSDPQSPVSASFDLGTIQSSAPGTDTVPVTVTNSGDMPVTMSWTAVIGPNASSPSTPLLTDKFTAVDPSALLGLAPGGNVFLPNPGDTQTLDIGFNWTELDNPDLGTAGTVTYTFTCTDALPNPSRLTLAHSLGALAHWDGQSVILKGVQGKNLAGTATVNDAGAALPEREPRFTLATPGYPNASSVYFNVVLTNNDPDSTSIGGTRPTASFVKAPGRTTWALANAPAHAWTWDEIRAYADDNDSAVILVRLVVRATDFAGEFTCFQYDGPIFGSGC